MQMKESRATQARPMQRPERVNYRSQTNPDTKTDGAYEPDRIALQTARPPRRQVVGEAN
jgi:hypothetical protein